MAKDVDAVMQSMPEAWRTRWCGAEGGPCACMGCVQVGNRLIMVGKTASQRDPEYISERNIPNNVYKKYKVSHGEWLAWMERNKQ
jgi:hypothetical protein